MDKSLQIFILITIQKFGVIKKTNFVTPLIWCFRNISYYYHVQNIVLLNIFVEPETCFRILWWIEMLKEKH